MEELFEDEERICRSTAGLGVELGGEVGESLVANTFVCAVIEINILLAPPFTEGRSIYGIAVVLAGDEAAIRAYFADGLVVATVSVLHLADLCPEAAARSWLPMQIPQMGFSLSSALRMCSTVMLHILGSPGPLDRKSPSKSI